MRFRILFLLILSSFTAAGQHNHYIYIQSDNAQLFFIRKGSEVISSSGSGFIILPRLQPGQQELSVGFPKNEFPEYQFTVDIKGKDRGFALKNFSEKGWGLFDLQSLEVIMGRKVEPKKEEQSAETGPMTNDPFSIILASAVDDPGIRQTSLVYYEEPVADKTQVKTSAVNTTSTPPTEIAKSDPPPGKVTPPKDDAMKKKSGVVTTAAPTRGTEATADPNKAAVTTTDPSKVVVTTSDQPKTAVVIPDKSKGATTTTEPSKSVVTNAGPPKAAETKAEPVNKEDTVKTKSEPIKKEETAKTKSEPEKKEETVTTKSEPVTVEETAKTGPTRKDPPKSTPLSTESASKTAVPEVKREGNLDSANELNTQSTNATAKKGEQKKTGLVIKNPFAKKKPAPVTSDAGVVMTTGSEKDSAKENVASVDQQSVNQANDSGGAKGSAQGAKRSYVVKFSEYRNGNEITMIYIDHQATHDDTIRLSITEDSKAPMPVVTLTEKDTLSKSAQPPVVKTDKPSEANSVPPVKNESTSETVKPAEQAVVKEDSALAGKKTGSASSASAKETRTDCRKMASEKDMVAMRKKMIMMSDEDEMIALALKDFKARCYSTERLQNLSYVFTTDKGRYKLFDAAYPYVYDPANYPQLERLLNEEYYIKRFHALVN